MLSKLNSSSVLRSTVTKVTLRLLSVHKPPIGFEKFFINEPRPKKKQIQPLEKPQEQPPEKSQGQLSEKSQRQPSEKQQEQPLEKTQELLQEKLPKDFVEFDLPLLGKDKKPKLPWEISSEPLSEKDVARILKEQIERSEKSIRDRPEEEKKLELPPEKSQEQLSEKIKELSQKRLRKGFLKFDPHRLGQDKKPELPSEKQQEQPSAKTLALSLEKLLEGFVKFNRHRPEEEKKQEPPPEKPSEKTQESPPEKPPKGFEKFFRSGQRQEKKPEPPSEKPQEQTSEKTQEPPPENPQEPSKSKGSSKKPDFEFPSFSSFSQNFGSGKPGSHFLLMTCAAGLAFLLTQRKQATIPTISIQDLVRKYIEPDLVKKLVIELPNPSAQDGVRVPGLITILACSSDQEPVAMVKVPNVQNFLATLEFEQKVMNRDRSRWVQIEYRYHEGGRTEQTGNFIMKNFTLLSQLLMVCAGIYFYKKFTKNFRGGSGGSGSGGGFDIFNMSKANFKVYGTDIKIETRFKDVAGLREAKKEIMEFVDFLKKPEKFVKLGAKIPKGALLVGPPGTGKTLLAKAAAGEAGVPFFTVSGSDFVEMFVGVGASRVRQLFTQAKERAPSIIFIDEIDAVGRKRHGRIGGNDEKDQTLNQLLVEMDGFATDTQVVVLAGTNRKDVLDTALLRPGRFDRTIELTLPDIDGREEILMIHLAPLKLNPDMTIVQYAKRLSALTPGFSGADLANLCNESAILAARKNKESIDRSDFESAAERVIGGLERSRKLEPKEREIVAYHESGHAAAAWFLEGADPVLKVSILPRSKGALGFAQFLPSETMLYSKDALLDKICATLAGRVAEELFFGRVTSGAQNDIQKATEIAMALVTSFGMSARLGPVGYSLDQESFGKPFSQMTNKLIDEDVREIIKSCLAKTRVLLSEKKPLVAKLAAALLEKERVVHKDLEDALGPRPFPIKTEYEKYIYEEEHPTAHS